MNVKIIKTDEDYNQALNRFEKIFHAPANTKDGDEAELLSLLIEKYEEEHYPIEAPDPLFCFRSYGSRHSTSSSRACQEPFFLFLPARILQPSSNSGPLRNPYRSGLRSPPIDYRLVHCCSN